MRPALLLLAWAAGAGAVAFNASQCDDAQLTCLSRSNSTERCFFGTNSTFSERALESAGAHEFVTRVSLYGPCRFFELDFGLAKYIPKDQCNDSLADIDAHELNIVLLKKYELHPDDPDCSQIETSFCSPYRTTGCYNVNIIPRDSSGSSRAWKKWFWIENNATKEEFEFRTPIITPTYSTNEGNLLNITWKFDEKTIMSSDFQCQYCYNITSPNNNTSLLCDSITENCDSQGKEIHCTISDLPESNYTFILKLEDKWRCSPNIYGNCTFHKTEEILVPSTANLEFNPGNAWLGIILTLVIVSFLCIMSLFCWRIYKNKVLRKKWIKQFEQYLIHLRAKDNKESKHEIKEIFLLYARDCEKFMDVMKIFRAHLAEVTGCTVYDIFDQSRINEVASSPIEWAMSLINDPHVKVVVVATECADKLYNILMKQSRNQELEFDQFYIQPEWLDNVVLHSLKLISNDPKMSYNKYYVIRFPKFDKKSGYLSHVTPHKRFEIPRCLPILVDSILEMGHGSNDVEITLNPDNSSALECELDKLNRFFKTNPFYLSDTLLKSEIINA